jgi:hypothetical protein
MIRDSVQKQRKKKKKTRRDPIKKTLIFGSLRWLKIDLRLMKQSSQKDQTRVTMGD